MFKPNFVIFRSKKTVEEQVTQSDNNSTNEYATATHSSDIVATADPNIDPLVTPVSMPQLIPFNYVPNSGNCFISKSKVFYTWSVCPSYISSLIIQLLMLELFYIF